MNNNFFQELQNYWMKSFNEIDLNAWMKNLQQQNLHFCGPQCNNISKHAMDIAKINSEFLQNNMEECFAVAGESMKANNIESVVANSQHAVQNMALNTANYTKQMLNQMADCGISFYEHCIDLATEQCNKYGNGNQEKE